MKSIKQLTQAQSLWKAAQLIWEAGIKAYAQQGTLEDLEAKKTRLEEESLYLSRLMHDYETKIHNVVRENQELLKQNRELEWAYRALRRENSWLKEEIFKLKDKPH